VCGSREGHQDATEEEGAAHEEGGADDVVNHCAYSFR